METGAEKKVAILFFFLPKGQLQDHDVFHSPKIAPLSHEYPFVKMVYQPHQPLRQVMKVGDETTIVVADCYGNPVHRFTIKDFSQEFKESAIRTALRDMPDAMQKLQKGLEKKLSKAEGDIKRKKYARALEVIQAVMEYRGYPTYREADILFNDIMDKGLTEVAELKAGAGGNPKRAIGKLKKIIKEFKDTNVEDAARNAIRELESQQNS
jgi:ribosomal protein L22